MIVGFMASGESGKSKCAEILADELGFTRVSYTEPIITVLYEINPIVLVTPEDYQKVIKEMEWKQASQFYDMRINNYGGFYYFRDLHVFLGYDVSKRIKMVREYYQRAGTEAGRNLYGQDVWINLAEKKFDKSENVVIENVRFENEALSVLRKDGFLVKINRPGFGNINNHISDTGIPYHLATHTLENDGTVADLPQKVRDLYHLLDAETNSLQKTNFIKEKVIKELEKIKTEFEAEKIQNKGLR